MKCPDCKKELQQITSIEYTCNTITCGTVRVFVTFKGEIESIETIDTYHYTNKDKEDMI